MQNQVFLKIILLKINVLNLHLFFKKSSHFFYVKPQTGKNMLFFRCQNLAAQKLISEKFGRITAHQGYTAKYTYDIVFFRTSRWNLVRGSIFFMKSHTRLSSIIRC